MTDQGVAKIKLQALLLADHIYCDRGTGKYVIAGTFYQLNVAVVPATFGRSVGAFVSLSGLNGNTRIDLEFVDPANGEVLLRTPPFDIACGDPASPVEFALEIPPLPLPHAGSFSFRLSANGGVLGSVSVFVRDDPGAHPRQSAFESDETNYDRFSVTPSGVYSD